MSEQRPHHEGEFKKPQGVPEVLRAVWENPLVMSNPEALEFRVEGRRKIRQLYQGYLDEDDYVALPVKANLWGGDHGTRQAFVSILLKDSDKKQRDFRYANNEASDDRIEIVRHLKVSELLGHHNEGYEIFLTPDEYIVGNQEAAAAIRLKAIGNHRTARHWTNGDDSIERYFRKNYVEYGVSGKKDSGRRRRFEKALRVRAQQEPVAEQEQWRRDYVAGLTDLRLPQFLDFKEYLEKTDGRVTLLAESDSASSFKEDGQIFPSLE